MRKKKATWCAFVKTDSGRYLLQVHDCSRWPWEGFALYDGHEFWPGGLGFNVWHTVDSNEVPETIKKEFQTVIEQYQ
jgi:hypothetical protein